MVTASGRYDHAIEPSPIATETAAALPAPLRPDGPFGCFADDLLHAELPDLPTLERHATVAFVCRRAGQLPAPLRLGVVTLSVAVGAGHRFAGRDRTLNVLQRTSLPLVGELARMVRSLGFAYVWETWPDSSPTGGPA